MNFCPKIKAMLLALAFTFIAAPAFSYSEAQRAVDFYKHQNYKKQQERKRIAYAKEHSRQSKQKEAIRERQRKQFIRSGRNKKVSVEKYESQYLKEIAKKQRQYKERLKAYVRQRNLKSKKRSKSQISENKEFDINTSLDKTKYY